MRKLLSFFLLAAFVVISACEGPMGPPGLTGPQGPQGQAGVNIVAEAFEVDVNFTAANDYMAVFDFQPPIFEDDVVMIYISWEFANGNTIWRALPQTLFLEEGVLVYNYDFSRVDFSVFLESSFDPGILPLDFTRNQVFRVVIIPADLGSRIDYNDYEGVVKMLGLSDKDFVKLEGRK
ncbi:collagen-like triple helix repeat-containing protein [Cognataquiflexum aquatile]|uniref:collagen-like triple helix repeat-containing protein n=1 Tax=Cognataquiflexum aquatile TaxID=2249427 RepID=UPI000DEB72DA|nr:collagen-like protein [Cognataquiflexum aquatile]